MVGGIIGGITSAVNTAINSHLSDTFCFEKVIASFAIGAAAGALATALPGAAVLINTVGAAVESVTTDVIDNLVNGEDKAWHQMAIDAAVSAGFSYLSASWSEPLKSDIYDEAAQKAAAVRKVKDKGYTPSKKKISDMKTSAKNARWYSVKELGSSLATEIPMSHMSWGISAFHDEFYERHKAYALAARNAAYC